MGLHAAIIRLSPLIHEGEQRYKPYIVGDPRMVSLSVTPPLKNPGYAPALDSTVQWTLIYPVKVNLRFEQPGPESQIITGMVSFFPDVLKRLCHEVPILYTFF